MGCCVIDCKVLEEMAAKYVDIAWFATSTVFQEPKADDPLQSRTPTFYGEDVWFFRRLKEMGVPTYLDCELVAGHVHYGIIDDSAWRMKTRLQQEQGLTPDQDPVV
jgi:hypothetical protein